MALRARKVSGVFEKRPPGHLWVHMFPGKEKGVQGFNSSSTILMMSLLGVPQGTVLGKEAPLSVISPLGAIPTPQFPPVELKNISTFLPSKYATNIGVTFNYTEL